MKIDDPDGGAATDIPCGPNVFVGGVPMSVVNVSQLKKAIKREFAPDLDHIAAHRLKIKYGDINYEDPEQLLSDIGEPAGRSSKTPLLVELPTGE